MRTGFNPELRKCIDEMRAIAKRYDAMPFIVLADGKGHGEFGLFTDCSWTCLHISDGQTRIKASSKIPGDSKKLDMTANALGNINGVMQGVGETIASIWDSLKKVVQIEEDKHAGFSPRLDT